ncbi:DUF1460 domain-containing protein [Maribellus comscasis]|uniref:DUF1460 domain-containing protein n=1 Tax=Maribellus comscasis TaxID=2681766 RepID=A0A6I6JHQ1_9BACT|nr:N-acetylmuramoyl-L-alanine amidase-like domain-containing protein [Maribellus comscasis]QGY42316.1 DUF1460 domain-containing protein [Maribellus comscasis]
MKRKILLFVVLPLFFACNAAKENKTEEQEKIVVQAKDKQILEEILELFSGEKDSPLPVLMIKVGTFFKETPYVAHTLETEPEQLVINLREMDCTTFAENCLAISKTIKSKNPGFEKFAKELQKIRYINEKIEAYPSRIHYFSDWIFTNDKKGIVKKISKEIADTEYDLKVSFMSTHPDSYKQLKNNPEFVKQLQEQEKEISSRTMYYIPKNKIAEVENKFQDGDIAGITTNIGGLDILHVVLLIRKEGRIHILHASSTAEKVVISENTLEDYLLKSKSATGVMVARPL